MFKDIVKASRSYRGYDESYRFSREELEDFVDCARFAPSSVNAQSFRYYLAWEKEEVDRIQKLTNWARALPQMQLPHPGMCPTGFIVICQDLNLGASIPRYQKDVGIVAQTMLLAAAERGLGGCMIGNYNAVSQGSADGYRLSKHFGSAPATSASPPVLINGTASDVANKILFICKYPSLCLDARLLLFRTSARYFLTFLSVTDLLFIILQNHLVEKSDFCIQGEFYLQ